MLAIVNNTKPVVWHVACIHSPITQRKFKELAEVEGGGNYILKCYKFLKRKLYNWSEMEIKDTN